MTSRKTAIATDPRLDGDRPPGCIVYVAEGEPEDRGKRVELTAGQLTVGAAEECGLRLTDSRVSRTHAQLAVIDEGIAITDLGSTNGTFFLGSQIDKAVLAPGAELRVGGTVLILLPLPGGEGIEPDEADHYGELWGISEAMRRIFAILKRFENSEPPVLIQGETGTGKELVARTIHDKSPRREHPFVIFDCGSVPADLVNSELFGHVRGAFSGAVSDRPGLFRRAHRGTLFLDEIGELPLELQPRLLRALESGQVRRVGEDEYTTIDARVIAATNRDLKAAVKEGTFREDLYYRLAIVQLTVPPLRERRSDIPLLARKMAESMDRGEQMAELPDRVLTLMAGHEWPGNVRELRNAVQRLVYLGDLDEPVTAARTGEIDPSQPYKEAKDQVLADFESAYVAALLEHHDGNISAAARAAGIGRRHFRALAVKHGLKK